jgi:hypothetical protein
MEGKPPAGPIQADMTDEVAVPISIRKLDRLETTRFINPNGES